jgi:CDP-diacylglycerol--glycerol-3-phosphate 3-phosphatidyltransferase
MKRLWTAIKTGYVRLLEPLAALLVRHDVNPNLITTFGTVCSIIGGCIYGSGHIRTGGWWLGVTALFDVLDGTVARRTGRSSAFGAFYDSTLDRIADGAVMSGLAFFYATSTQHGNVPMIAVCLVGLLGGFLVSYTRARAEALGVDAKVGFMQRPERVVLLSAPQAFFGLALDGWILAAIIVSLTVTSWATAIHRIIAVHHATVNSTSSHREAVRSTPVAPVAAEPQKAAKAVNV